MWKTQSCEVCEFCILLYHARKSVTTFPNSKVGLIGVWSISPWKRFSDWLINETTKLNKSAGPNQRGAMVHQKIHAFSLFSERLLSKSYHKT